MQVVFLGPPGVGKGTQAKRVAERLGIAHVATGDIFRANLAQGTPLGLKARAFMEQGTLVPDDVTEAMVADRLDQPDCRAGFVLDGFPRNLHQAEALDALLAQRGRRLSVVVQLVVAEAVLLERLTGRRVCRQCGATYHVRFQPPRREGVCDLCGGPLVQRPDDREETVRRRLEVYAEETRPLEEWYRRRGLLRVVDGDGAVEAVTERTLKVLDDFAHD